jgi:hypothetical protein
MNVATFLAARLSSDWRAPMYRTRAIVLFLSVPTLALLTAGCSDDPKATPQIIFDGHLEHGTGNTCHQDSTPLLIGDFGNLAATPPVPSHSVKDGESAGQGTVSVSCSVTAAGSDVFNVSGSVDLSGATGGFFRIDGQFKTTGDQPNIHALFASRLTTNTYEEQDKNCTVRYTTQFQGVAAGRVWGDITCPKAVNLKVGGDQEQCEVHAQFRFENCAQ